MLTPAEHRRLSRLTARLAASRSTLQKAPRLSLEELAELIRLHAKYTHQQRKH